MNAIDRHARNHRLLRSRAAVLALLAFVCAHRAPGAPSVEFAGEFCVNREFTVGGFALVDKASGQVRVGTISAANDVTFAGSFPTYLSGVTAVTSGFQDGVSIEQLALSSTSANRVVFAPVDGSPATAYFPQQPGPSGIALLRESAATPKRLLLHSLYGADGNHYLELTADANLGTPMLIDDSANLLAIASLQPNYTSPGGRREAVAVWDADGNPRLRTFYEQAGALYGTAPPPTPLPLGSRLAANARDNFNMLIAIAYTPGSTTLWFIPFNTTTTPFTALWPFTAYDVPFPVGSVAEAVNLFGAPRGMLVTSQDGTQAVYAEIVTTGGVPSANILQSFTNTDPALINGLIGIAGRGILLLEGTGGVSSQFSFFKWNGAAFALEDQGAIPPLLAPQTDFATVLWYDAEPLVDLAAELLRIDIHPDWTNGAGPLPASLTAEMFVDSDTGLANPMGIAPPPPAGAMHVLTNQLLASCSLAILQENSKVLDPPLTVDPPGGSYDDTVRIKADTIEGLYDVFYRENTPGKPWRTYASAFGVAYDSSWLFYAKHKTTGDTGPIVSRTYSFTGDPLSRDSDNDGVPDFVEQHLGLDPFGGADSDGDLQSDLEEILDENDPADPAEFEPAANRDPPFLGEGFLLIAEAVDTTTGKASPGERIDARTMTGAVLASGNVTQLASPPVLTGELGAPLTVNTPVSRRHLAVLHSPLYFDLGTSMTPPRDGREVYRLLEIPEIPPPAISPALSGNDLDADASAWIAAAQAAYAAYDPVTSITTIGPLDTAAAVLGEAAIHDALLQLEPGAQAALGVPAVPEGFTLFGARDGDAERVPMTEAMILALEADGLSFVNLLAAIETGVHAATADAMALRDVTNALYDFHVANSDANPLMPLPLDVLRLLARGDPLPAPYDTAGISPANLTGAQTAITGILAQLGGAYRPVAMLALEVGPPTIPGQKYGYTNTATSSLVAVLDAFGNLLNLDQGLGLAHGSVLSVLGYTDVTGPPGHQAIEPIAIAVISLAVATDEDTNANLLDDWWEFFFFGAPGVVNPFDPHPVSGYSYLQYFLSGADPRADSMDQPGEPMLDLGPPEVDLVELVNGNFGLQFVYPDNYFGAFDWKVQHSGDLSGFDPLPAGNPVASGGGLYEIDLGADASSYSVHFFRLIMALK